MRRHRRAMALSPRAQAAWVEVRANLLLAAVGVIVVVTLTAGYWL